MHTTQNIVTCKHSVSFFIRANIIIRIIDANIIVGVIRLALFVRRRFVVALTDFVVLDARHTDEVVFGTVDGVEHATVLERLRNLRVKHIQGCQITPPKKTQGVFIFWRGQRYWKEGGRERRKRQKFSTNCQKSPSGLEKPVMLIQKMHLRGVEVSEVSITGV